MSLNSRRYRCARHAFVFVVVAAAAAAAHASARWSDGYALVVLEPGADLRRATQHLQAQGATVALELPPRCVAGWVPPDVDAAIIGHAGIRSVHRDINSL